MAVITFNAKFYEGRREEADKVRLKFFYYRRTTLHARARSRKSRSLWQEVTGPGVQIVESGKDNRGQHANL